MAQQDADQTLAELIAIGRRHRKAGEWDAAVAVFTLAHQRYPQAPRPLVERGAILILQRRYPESRSDYDEAASRDPGHPGLASYVAELDLYTGRAAQALALSREAARHEPDNLMHRLNIAHALLLLGRTEDAIRTYRECAPQFHPVKQRTGAALALDDLNLLVEAGVRVPQVEQVRAVLTNDRHPVEHTTEGAIHGTVH